MALARRIGSRVVGAITSSEHLVLQSGRQNGDAVLLRVLRQEFDADLVGRRRQSAKAGQEHARQHIRHLVRKSPE